MGGKSVRVLLVARLRAGMDFLDWEFGRRDREGKGRLGKRTSVGKIPGRASEDG